MGSSASVSQKCPYNSYIDHVKSLQLFEGKLTPEEKVCMLESQLLCLQPHLSETAQNVITKTFAELGAGAIPRTPRSGTTLRVW